MQEQTPSEFSSPLRGLRVLVVDDLAAACETLGLLLELEGAQVRTAACAKDALALAALFSPHAVVLDLCLPDLDGVQLAMQLRQLHGQQGAALIALSGYSLHAGAWGQGAAHVFDACWVKPADVGELVRFLARTAPWADAREK